MGITKSSHLGFLEDSASNSTFESQEYTTTTLTESSGKQKVCQITIGIDG